jgi:transcription initiation factor TFIIB
MSSAISTIKEDNTDLIFKNFEKKANADSIWNCFDQFSDLNTSNIINKNEISEEKSDIEKTYACSECKSFNLLYADGQLYCGDCNIMQDKRLSHEAEYRFYGTNDSRSANPERVGMPTNSLLPKSSIGTLIQKRSYDNPSIKRMVQYNSWNQMPYKERALYKICCGIKNKSTRGGLPTIIIERAKELYNIVKEVNISRGDNRDGLIAACVWVACKDIGVPRSSKEIAKIFEIELKDMTRGIKFFRENWRLAEKGTDKISRDSSNPLNFIERYCSPLPVSIDVKHIAEFIAVRAIFENLVDDNTAPSIAAGSIFLAATITRNNVTKKQVADSCKTSEVTISKCFKKLNESKLKLLPKAVIKKYNIK